MPCLHLWEMIAQHYDTYREIVIRSNLQIESERIAQGNNLMWARVGS
jgi:hypothetical protein